MYTDTYDAPLEVRNQGFSIKARSGMRNVHIICTCGNGGEPKDAQPNSDFAMR